MERIFRESDVRSEDREPSSVEADLEALKKQMGL